MTTDLRAEAPRRREDRTASNFHAPGARDAYGRHFSGIGIASVAAAAAQVRRGRPGPVARREVPPVLLEDHDAA